MVQYNFGRCKVERTAGPSWATEWKGKRKRAAHRSPPQPGDRVGWARRGTGRSTMLSAQLGVINTKSSLQNFNWSAGPTPRLWLSLLSLAHTPPTWVPIPFSRRSSSFPKYPLRLQQSLGSYGREQDQRGHFGNKGNRDGEGPAYKFSAVPRFRRVSL